jgi:hypothetical protein
MTEPTFIVSTNVRDAETFEQFARIANPLKKYGKVAMRVGHVAVKTTEDLPPGGSPWHEYTTWMSSLTRKIFPHPKLQPFVDMDKVAKNVELLRACAAVLRKHGMSAALSDHEPFFMPEEFFAKYPHLRGPRCDHPRRASREAYSTCRDSDEGREMLEWSVRELMKEVPEVSDIGWCTNDAGAGICWTDYLYPGINGPDHCRGINAGRHIANVAEGYLRGCDRKAEIIILKAMIFGSERALARECLDREKVTWPEAGDPGVMRLGVGADNPLNGLFDPVGVLGQLEKFDPEKIRKVIVGFGVNNYSRSHARLDVAAKIVELTQAQLEAPARGTRARLNLLADLCERWVGPDQAEALLEALLSVHEAMKYKRAAIPQLTCNYIGVSMRHITRPLVAMPERLTSEEESYFLPHVFNPSTQQARMDYLDLHGSRLGGGAGRKVSTDPRLAEVGQLVGRLCSAAAQLEKIAGDGDAALFRGLGLSLRMYASIMRSIGNFHAMQHIRDRNAELLAGEPRVHPKLGTRSGDSDNLLIQEFMRDELDNVGELVDLLENGGMEWFITALDAEEEDTFILGPDVLDQLRRKMTIMRRHWCDAEEYLAPPHK